MEAYQPHFTGHTEIQRWKITVQVSWYIGEKVQNMSQFYNLGNFYSRAT